MTNVKPDFDAVIIGAGFSGMYMLHSLRDKLELKVTVFEAGNGIGGTWYWNRYPGARCDSDSYIYCLHIRQEAAAGMGMVRALSAAGRDPALPRTLSRSASTSSRDIQFGKRVVERRLRRRHGLWTVRTDKGDTVKARFSSPRSARCRPPTCRRSRASVPSRASVTTPANGRTTASISPPSALASSAPARRPCRRFPRSRSRPSS